MRFLKFYLGKNMFIFILVKLENQNIYLLRRDTEKIN